VMKRTIAMTILIKVLAEIPILQTWIFTRADLPLKHHPSRSLRQPHTIM